MFEALRIRLRFADTWYSLLKDGFGNILVNIALNRGDNGQEIGTDRKFTILDSLLQSESLWYLD